MRNKALLSLLLLTAVAANAQNGEPDINVRSAVSPDTLTVSSNTLPISSDTLPVSGDLPSPFTLPPSPSFGYLSYDSVLHAMPRYIDLPHRMKELREAYEAEMKRVEDEFNQKYEAFLEGRKDYPRTILLKRQNELQDLLKQNVAFRNRALDELRQAETAALAPLRQQLLNAVATVAKQNALAFVLNTDQDACLFIDPSCGIDLTAEVLCALLEQE